MALLNSSPFDSSQSTLFANAFRAQDEEMQGNPSLQSSPAVNTTMTSSTSPLCVASVSQPRVAAKTSSHLSSLSSRLVTAHPEASFGNHLTESSTSLPHELVHGTRLYFASFAKTVPIVGHESDFQHLLIDLRATNSASASLLQHTVASLGYILAHGAASQAASRLRVQSRSLSQTVIASASTMDSSQLRPTLATVQALILIAYDEFGSNRLTEAELHLHAAASLSLRIGLNRLDEVGSSSSLCRHLHEPVDKTNSPYALNGSALMQMGRRTWWELYICDMMLHMATSRKTKLALVGETIIVHAPSDFEDQNGFITSRQSGAYDLRVRAAALIGSCTELHGARNAPELDRITAIDTILSNLLVQAQLKWTTAASQHAAQKSDDSRCWALETQMEMLFTTMTVLHAARIHLHRQAWFADLTMDFESCSFAQPTQNLHENSPQADRLPASSRRDEETQNMLAVSTAKIISSADAILRLVRLDQRMRVDAEMNRLLNGSDMGSQHLVSGHSPFFGCCSMVASFGYLVAIAASGPTQANLPTYNDEVRMFDSNQLGTIDATAFMLDSPGLQILQNLYAPDERVMQSRTDSVKQLSESAAEKNTRVWKIRAALSNIRLAESVLAQHAFIWPIASVYQQEVSMCHQSIDQFGPVG